ARSAGQAWKERWWKVKSRLLSRGALLVVLSLGVVLPSTLTLAQSTKPAPGKTKPAPKKPAKPVDAGAADPDTDAASAPIRTKGETARREDAGNGSGI